MGAAGGIGTCSTRSGRSRRSDRTVGTPPRPRQVASAGAGAVLRACRPRGAGARGELCRCRLAPAPAPKGPTPPCCPASLLVALDRCGQTADLSHASHTLDAHRPFRAGRLLRRLPARGAAAGTRRHAPRSSPSAPPLHPATPPSPQRAIPLPALTLPAPALCRPCVSPRAHEATLLFPRPSLLFLCRCSLP